MRKVKGIALLVVESNIVKDLKKIEYEIGSKEEERIFKAEDSKIIAFRVALEVLRRLIPVQRKVEEKA